MVFFQVANLGKMVSICHRTCIFYKAINEEIIRVSMTKQQNSSIAFFFRYYLLIVFSQNFSFLKICITLFVLFDIFESKVFWAEFISRIWVFIYQRSCFFLRPVDQFFPTLNLDYIRSKFFIPTFFPKAKLMETG